MATIVGDFESSLGFLLATVQTSSTIVMLITFKVQDYLLDRITNLDDQENVAATIMNRPPAADLRFSTTTAVDLDCSDPSFCRQPIHGA